MATHAGANVFIAIIRRRHQTYFNVALRVDIYFVVIVQYTGIQPYEPTTHTVAKRTTVTGLSPLAKALVVFDIDNPSEQGWQRHFHVSLTCKNVETKKMGLSTGESILKWKHSHVNN